MVSLLARMKSLRARVSDSEKASGPAKVSLQGFEEAPVTAKGGSKCDYHNRVNRTNLVMEA